MKRKGIIVLVLSAMLLGAVIYCPASFLRGLINDQLAGVARLENVDGTIWRGEALLVFEARQMPQTPVNWRFSPSLLKHGALGYTVELNRNNANNDSIFGALTVAKSWNDVHVRQVKISAPAAAILPLLSPSLSYGAFSGQLSFATEQLTLTPNPTFAAAKITGQSSLNWRGANSLFLLGAAANEYLIEFDGKGAESNFSLKTISGPIAANGQGTRLLEASAPHNAVKFSGRAQLPQALLSRLGNASAWLNQLGRMEGDQLIINWNGRI